MGLVDAVVNLAVDAATAELDRISLHTADPGGTGANEVTGGSPAYARQTPTWDPAATKVAHISDPLLFDIPAGTTVTHMGTWTSGGTWRGGKALSAPEAFGAQGVYELTDATVTGSSPA